MRTGNVLFSAVQLIFVILLFMMGALFLGIEHAPHFRARAIQMILENGGHFAYLGYGITAFAFLLLCGFFVMNRGGYYQVEMQRHGASVEPEVIRRYVQCYWNEIFPGQERLPEVVLHGKKKIEIFAQIPDLDAEDLSFLLPRIEEELGILLSHTFGYRDPFLLTVSSPV